ncbi:MAG: ATP-binding protein, partial [Romboutsia sp.]|nr:ATP-binding protein [Romboutsia sp.]
MVEVSIIPDVSLWNKLGNIKYTIPKALYELIDNSIDARLNDKVTVDIFTKSQGDYIIVKDNGKGMNLEELTKCLTISSQNINQGAIGEHGFGLKSSTSYLCNEFVLYTKKENNENIYKYHHKKDEFSNWVAKIEQISKREFINEIYNSELNNLVKSELKVDDFNNGTIIFMSDLKVKIYKGLTVNTNTTKSLKILIQRKYPYKLGSILNINLHFENKNYMTLIEVEPNNYKPNINLKIHFKLKIFDRFVFGWIGLLENTKGKNKSFQGLNLIKNGNIIESNLCFGYSNHPEYRLITGELNMDEFETTVNKTNFARDKYFKEAEELIGEVLINTIISTGKSRENKKNKTYDIETKIKNNLILNIDDNEINKNEILKKYSVLIRKNEEAINLNSNVNTIIIDDNRDEDIDKVDESFNDELIRNKEIKDNIDYKFDYENKFNEKDKVIQKSNKIYDERSIEKIIEVVETKNKFDRNKLEKYNFMIDY